MLKQRLWLAVAGLAAGAVLAYVQVHQSAPVRAPRLPAASAVNFAPPSRQQRLPAAEPSPPPAAVGTAPTTLARLPEQPAAPSPAPTASFLPPAPETSEDTGEPFFGFFTADNSVWATPLLPNDGKLWTRSMCLEANLSSSDGRLSFVNKKTDDDPLKSFTFSNMSDVGTQYPLIKNGGTTFLGRVAGGLSRDYAGLAENQRIPEVLLGCQFEQQITQRQKILGGVDYARDVTDPARHRVRTQAAWEVLLDPDRNVSLRTGILESSNKAPTGEQATNLNYTVDLIWKF